MNDSPVKTEGLTADLLSWEELKSRHDWGTLLLGNGASISVWDGFRYESLYKNATSSFDDRTSAIFSALGTTNFEEVLSALAVTKALARAVNDPGRWVDPCYATVRDGLFDAVRGTHVPWVALANATLPAIASAVVNYRSVFTLNYDLLLYWAAQLPEARARIVDFLWSSGTFDRTNIDIYEGKSAIYYLHGGLHLWRDVDTGGSGKWFAPATGNLLDSLPGWYNVGTKRQPLFISEGTATEKLRSIRRSDYLNFCHGRLVDDSAATVIFGANLGGFDSHVIQAINSGLPRPIAISIYRPKNRPDWSIIEAKVSYLKAFPQHDLAFFDSRTYPLGDPGLSVSAKNSPT